MDFHNMKRKELQKLCKQHKLPANLTNLELANNLSSLFKTEEKGKYMGKTRSCLKNSGEILSENDSDGLGRKPKKVRFSPQNDVFELGNKKTEFVDYKGIERGKSKKRDLEDTGDENKGVPVRLTRARASLGGKEVMLSSPVVTKKRVKRVVREDDHSDKESSLAVDSDSGVPDKRNKVITVKSLRNRTVQNVGIPERVVREDDNNNKESSLAVDLDSGVADDRNEVIMMKSLRNRTVQNVVIPKKIAKTRKTQKQSEGGNADILKNKDAEANRGITRRGLRRSTRNMKVSEESEGLNGLLGSSEMIRNGKMSSHNRLAVNVPEADCEKEPDFEVKNENAHMISGKSLRRRVAKNTTSKGKEEIFESGEIPQPEKVLRRSKRHLLTDVVDDAKEETELTAKSGDPTMYQSRSGKEGMPHIKQGKKEELASGDLGPKRNTVEKGSSNQSRKHMLKKGSEINGNVRRSKRNASVDDSVTISKDANGSCSDIRKSTERKRGRDMILKEVPSQHTNHRGKLKRETTVVVPSQTKSGEKDLPRQSGELVVPKHSENESELRRSKRNANGADLLATYTDTDATITSSKKIVARKEASAKIPNLADTKDQVSIGVAELSTSSSIKLQSRQELNNELFSTKQTPVVQEPFRRLTRSAQKGKTDGPAYVRGKISQKKSHSLSKVPLLDGEASLPKATLNASDIVKDRTSAVLQDSFEEVGAKPPNFGDPTDLASTNEAASSPSFSVKLQTGEELVNELGLSKDTLVIQEASSRRITRSSKKSMTDGPAFVNQKLSKKKSQSISKLKLLGEETSSPKASLTAEEPTNINVQSSLQEVVTHPAVPASTSDTHKDNSACSIPQDSSAKTVEMTPYLQENRGPGLPNTPEASSSERLELQSIQNELVADIFASEHTPVRSPASPDVQDFVTHANNEAHVVPLAPVDESDAARDVVPVDRKSAADGFLSLELITSKAIEVSLEKDKNVGPSYGVVEHVVVEGSAIQEQQSVDQLPFPENKCCTSPVSSNNDVDKDDITRGEKSSEKTVASPHLNHVKPAEFSNVADDAFQLDTGSLADGFSLVHQFASMATEEKKESDNINHVIAEVATINEEKVGAETGECGPSVQEHDICYHSAGSEEGNGREKDSGKSSKKVEEAIPVHFTNRSVTMFLTEVKDDAIYSGVSVHAAEQHNTFSLSRTQGMKLPAPRSIPTTGELSILDSAFPATDVSDMVTSLFSNNELVENSQQRISTPESCLKMEISNLKEGRDSVAEGNNKSGPQSTSLLSATEVGDPVVEVTEEGEREESSSLWGTYTLAGRAAEVGNSLQEQNTVRSANVSVDNILKDGEDEFDIKDGVNVLGCGESVTEGNNKSGPKSPLLNATEVCDPLAEVNGEGEREESPSRWRSDTVAGRAAEAGNSLQQEQNTVRSANVFLDNVSKHSEDEYVIKGEVNVLDSGDSVAEGNDNSGPKSPLLNATEVGEPVAEVNGEGEREELPSRWSSDTVAGRAAEAVNSLQKEQNTVRSANISLYNVSKHSEDEFEDEVNLLDSGDSVAEGNNNSGPKSPLLHATVSVAEVNEEGEREESLSLWGSDTLAGRAAEAGSSLQNEQNTVRSANVSVDNILKDSRDEFDIKDKDNVLDVGDPETEGNEEGEREDLFSLGTSNTVAGMAAEDSAYLQKEPNTVRLANVSVENISKDSGDEFQIKTDVSELGSSTREVNKRKVPTEVCFDGKENDGTGDMRAFDYDVSEGKCTEFGVGTSNSLKEMVTCEVSTEPIIEGGEYKYDDNQTVGSASRHTSSSDSLKYKTIEESAPACPLASDEDVFEESLKGKSSALTDYLMEGGGGYYEISDKLKAESVSTSVLEEDNCSNYTKDSHQSVKTLEQSDMSFWETNCQGKGIHQEMDGRPSLVDIDDMGNNNANSIDITHRFDQEDNASGVLPTGELHRKEDAIVADADAPAKLVSGSEDQTPTEKTNEARVYSDILNHDSECGPKQSFFDSDIVGSELKSFFRSDEMDEEKSNSWSDRTNFILHNSVDIGKKHENINISLDEEQLHIGHKTGEEHLQEKSAGLVETRPAASDNHSSGADTISVEHSAITRSEAQTEPRNGDLLQQVASNSVKEDEDTQTES